MISKFAKLACPLAVAAALSFTAAPANAQFAGGGGGGFGGMEELAPIVHMMKQKPGARRFAQLTQTMGAVMGEMGGGGGMGGFGGGMPSMDMGQMMQMMGPMMQMMGPMMSMMGGGGGGHRHGRVRRHHG